MPEIHLPNGFVPRPAQAALMRHFDHGGLRGVYCWPRRYGKDLTALHQTIKMAHERPGMYFHMLPNHNQARKVLWDAYDNDGRRIIDVAIPPALRESTNETEMKIRLKCGGIWQLVGSDYYNSVMGANPFGLVFSEAALTDPRAWNFFRPILAGNGGWAMFISTPRGYNQFHELLTYAKGDPSWDWSHLTCLDTKHISAEVLASEQAQMPDELFRQEYMTDFSAANVGAIFGRYVEEAEKAGRIVQTLPPQLHGEVWITSDIGYRDKAAFVWWRRMRGGFEVFHYDEGTGMDAADWCDRLVDQPRADVLVLPHDARAKSFASKQTVAETFLKAEVAGEIRVNPQRKKMDSINAGRVMLRKVRFDATACHDLLHALRAYAFKYDEKTKTFSSEPEHNWSSHAADAYMEGAAALALLDAPEKTVEPIIPPLNYTFQLDKLWDTVGPVHQGRL